MVKADFNKLFLENEEGTFIPEYTYDDYIYNKKLGDYEYVNFKIIKTAREVYAAQLENKEKEPDKTKISPTNDELKEENEKLWETVEFLLKQVNMIPKE